jgi:hypothetical protein
LPDNVHFFRGQPNKENAVGYCHNPNHMGYLSAKIIKRHACLAKQCKYLHKYEDNPYWIERERKRAEKKARKKRG